MADDIMDRMRARADSIVDLLASALFREGADEIDRLRAAGAALYALLDEMHKCGRRQPGLTETLEGWEAVAAATKEDDRG